MSDKRRQGDAAEALALAHLKKHGLTLLKKNYHCRHGEIDLIMQDGAEIVFVEVRHRADHSAAAGSIDEHKQRRISTTAAHYLAGNGGELSCRFDAVLLNRHGELQWLKHAFDAGD